MANKVEKSNAAHSRLNSYWNNQRNSPENRARGSYHASCVYAQNELGRVLDAGEKKKLFNWWNKYERNHDSAGAYPSFDKKGKKK